MKIYIIPTSSAKHLVKNIIRNRDFEVIFPGLNRDKKRCFPDDEVYIKILGVNKLKMKELLFSILERQSQMKD